MGNAIPTKQRRQVYERDQQCVMCGGRGHHWHHRRRRAVKGGHYQHCACNGVLLCHNDHISVHSTPKWAMTQGLILPTHIDEPFTEPITEFTGRKIWLLCDGGISFLPITKGTP